MLTFVEEMEPISLPKDAIILSEEALLGRWTSHAKRLLYLVKSIDEKTRESKLDWLESDSPDEAITKEIASRSAFAKSLTELATAKAALEGLQSFAERNILKVQTTCFADKVDLDIGGKIFSTSLHTLTKRSGTFFSAQFGTNWAPTTREPIFIDRESTASPYILRFLRTGATVGTLPDAIQECLEDDLRYYILPIEGGQRHRPFFIV